MVIRIYLRSKSWLDFSTWVFVYFFNDIPSKIFILFGWALVSIVAVFAYMVSIKISNCFNIFVSQLGTSLWRGNGYSFFSDEFSHHYICCLLILFSLICTTFPNTICRNFETIWIGYHQYGPKDPNKWFWISDSKSTYTKWNSGTGEPNSISDECADIVMHIDSWNDDGCDGKTNFVCEKG